MVEDYTELKLTKRTDDLIIRKNSEHSVYFQCHDQVSKKH